MEPSEAMSIVAALPQHWPTVTACALIVSVAIARCLVYVVKTSLDHRHALQMLDRFASVPPGARRDFIELMKDERVEDRS